MAATISSWLTTSAARHVPLASSGMNSMNRTCTPWRRPNVGEVDDLVVVHAPLQHDVDLDRVEPGLAGGGDAVEHPVRARRGGSWRRSAPGRSESSEMFTRSRPAARSSWRHQAEGGAVRGERQVGLGAVGPPQRRPACRPAPAGGPAPSARRRSGGCRRRRSAPRTPGPAARSPRSGAARRAGSHCIPSSGMQYVQRKLHRSVIEMRRSRTVRPNGSTRSAMASG